MKKLLFVLFVLSICTSFKIEEEEIQAVVNYCKSKEVSTLSKDNFKTIFSKIETPKDEIKKIIIKEMQFGVQGSSIYIYVFSDKKSTEYFFSKNQRRTKVKFAGKKTIVNDSECGCLDNHIDCVNRSDIYILPFSNGKFLLDSAKHSVCQSFGN